MIQLFFHLLFQSSFCFSILGVFFLSSRVVPSVRDGILVLIQLKTLGTASGFSFGCKGVCPEKNGSEIVGLSYQAEKYGVSDDLIKPDHHLKVCLCFFFKKKKQVKVVMVNWLFVLGLTAL